MTIYDPLGLNFPPILPRRISISVPQFFYTAERSDNLLSPVFQETIQLDTCAGLNQWHRKRGSGELVMNGMSFFYGI
jgi:hypothetical protein